MGAFIYLLIGIIALGYYLVKKRYNYWSDRGFISSPGSFPFGSLQGVGIKMTLAEKTNAIYKKYKGKATAIGTYFFLDPTLMPIDPELCKNIFVRDFSSFHDRGFYYNKEDEPLSASVLVLEGQEWRDRRVKLSPIFTSGKMKMMFETVDMIGDKLITVINKQIGKASELDMKDLAAKYTSDVIGNVAFGLDCECLENPSSEFMIKGKRVFNTTGFELLKFFFANSLPNLSRKLHITVFAKESIEFFQETFIETLVNRENNKIIRNDFVSMLLGLKNHYTKIELAAEAFLVYTGGFETSSTLISFTLYELALNPDIQERLREEIKSELSNNEGKLTFEIIVGAQYLDQVINESLRKYPPIPTITRKSTKDYTIPGTNLNISKGTSIFLPVYSFHHDPEYYPEPEKFDPERFSPGDDVRTRHPFTFLPFGEGPRICLGLRFGLMQSKIAIAKILQNYKISPSDKTPIPMKFVPSGPFLAPVGNMWLNLKKIE